MGLRRSRPLHRSACFVEAIVAFCLTSELQTLSDCELNVTSPWRHVQDKKIQLRPSDLKEQLIQRFLQHQSAPGYRTVLRNQETHRHCFNAKGRKWHQAIVFVKFRFQSFQLERRVSNIMRRTDPRGDTNPQESRYAWTVDVRVKDADRDSCSDSSEGQVDSNRAFANTTFGTTDGDDVFDVWNWSFLW